MGCIYMFYIYARYVCSLHIMVDTPVYVHGEPYTPTSLARCTHTYTHIHTRTHARTHARARAHTHTHTQ